MSPEKVTQMILYVDLKCSCCYKKVRKLLCKFPEIRDQVFEVEKNRVLITVVCCDPERLRDKLCCKGGRTIQSIEILEPPPPPTNKPPPKKPDPPPPVVVNIPDPQPPPPVKKMPPVPIPIPQPQPPPPPNDPVPIPQPQPPPPVKKMPPPNDPIPQPQPQPVKTIDPPKPQPPVIGNKMPPMEPNFCPPPPPVSVCCQECYEGRGGGPCHYWRPGPPPCYDGGYGYNTRPPPPPCYVRCDYFSEENPQGCSIM